MRVRPWSCDNAGIDAGHGQQKPHPCARRRRHCRSGRVPARWRVGRGADGDGLWAGGAGGRWCGRGRHLRSQGPAELQSADRACGGRGPGGDAGGVFAAGARAGGEVLARPAHAGAAAPGGCPGGGAGDGGARHHRAALPGARGDAGAGARRGAIGGAISQCIGADFADARGACAGIAGGCAGDRCRAVRCGGGIDDRGGGGGWLAFAARRGGDGGGADGGSPSPAALRASRPLPQGER